MLKDTQREAAIEAAEKYRDGPNREGDAFVAGYLAAYDAARSGEAKRELRAAFDAGVSRGVTDAMGGIRKPAPSFEEWLAARAEHPEPRQDQPVASEKTRFCLKCAHTTDKHKGTKRGGTSCDVAGCSCPTLAEQDQPVDRASETVCERFPQAHAVDPSVRTLRDPYDELPEVEHPKTGERVRREAPRGSMLGLATASGVAVGTERPPEPLQDGGERLIETAFDRWYNGLEDAPGPYDGFVAGWSLGALARHPHQDVERLAQVIHADDANQEGKLAEWSSLSEHERDEYRSNARAVVAALTPSPDDRGGERCPF